MFIKVITLPTPQTPSVPLPHLFSPLILFNQAQAPLGNEYPCQTLAIHRTKFGFHSPTLKGRVAPPRLWWQPLRMTIPAPQSPILTFGLSIRSLALTLPLTLSLMILPPHRSILASVKRIGVSFRSLMLFPRTLFFPSLCSLNTGRLRRFYPAF